MLDQIKQAIVRRLRTLAACLLAAIFLVITGCNHTGDGSYLVLEGDERRNCSELHVEYEKAEALSEQSIRPRKRWITQLMIEKDCRLPERLESGFRLNLSISG
jgi:hypothetical protein